jgi:hypothetical protein
MAPFVDINGNGIYEPLLGEYPDIKGDQALWHVFSDNGPAHSETHGKPLGVEVHAMSYAWHRGTLIDNVVYYDYKVINKSPNNYTNMRVGQWDDCEVGYQFDDYIGFDSAWRMGICYNGTNDDGFPSPPVNSYGRNLPVVGLTMIVLPGDLGFSYVPAGSFDYYNNDFSFIGNPTVDSDYNNYLRAEMRNGQHYTNDFVGRGVFTKGYGTGPNCNYVYTGDPGDSTSWSECNCNNYPGDRRFILSSGDFTLNSGSSEHLVLALVTTDTNQHGCGAVNFNDIRIVADTAWGNYFKVTGVKDVPLTRTINVYPNPANDKLFIENNNNIAGGETITIYNTLGQVINVPVNGSGKKYEVDISKLPPGLYNILFRNNYTQSTTKFIKE